MSRDVELVMSKEDAIKSLQALKKENDAAQTDLNKLLKMRLFYQEQKELLLERHSQLTCVIDERKHKINQARQNTPGVTRKRFDQLYPLVEDIYFKELLLSELREQLLLVRIQRERSEILQVLKATDERLDKSSDYTTQNTTACSLIAWHQYITAFIKENERLSKQRIKKGSCLQKSVVFYNDKLHKCPPSSNDHELTFSTRHRCICVYISIRETRSTDSPSYTVTSDLPLNNLQSTGGEFLKCRKNPVDFVMDVVWKQIEDSILCVM